MREFESHFWVAFCFFFVFEKISLISKKENELREKNKILNQNSLKILYFFEKQFPTNPSLSIYFVSVLLN